MLKICRSIIRARVRAYLRRYRPLLIGVTGSSGAAITARAVKLALRENHPVRVSAGSCRTPAAAALAILGLPIPREIEEKDEARLTPAPEDPALQCRDECSSSGLRCGVSPPSEAKDVGARRLTLFRCLRLLVDSRLKEFTQEEPRIIVLELGATRPGDIDLLASQFSFRVVAVTNVHSAHLNLFGDKEMAAHEMMSAVVNLPQKGHAVLNADDYLVKSMAQRTKANSIFFAQVVSADVRLQRAHRVNGNGFACEVKVRGVPHELHLPYIVDRGQLSCVLVALAVASALEADIKAALRHLSRLRPPQGCLRLLDGLTRSQILDGSFDATAEDTLEALNTLRELSARRRLAVLGGVLNLGAQSQALHEEIGRRAARTADVLLAVGDNMRVAGAAALKEAENSGRRLDVHHFNDSLEAAGWVADFVRQDDLVLVKGSRGLRMEEAVKHLRK